MNDLKHTIQKNLTEDEITVLCEEFNLADGHAYRPWNEAEKAIIERSTELLWTSDRRHQYEIEISYLDAYFSLAGQSLPPSGFKCFLCFTASNALEVVANYLRVNRLSAALIEPCFDNLFDIFERHDIPLLPLSETLLSMSPDGVSQMLLAADADVIVLVSPNNPTGMTLNPVSMTAIIKHCRDHNKLLVLDSTFRFYLPPRQSFDQYSLISEAGIDCIVIEDTGKTWPTLELKAPFFCVSPGLAKDIGKIYSDFLLHVSPFTVRLLTQFFQVPGALGLEHIHALIAQNRNTLYRDLTGTFLVPQEASYMSTAWLHIQAPFEGEYLKEQLAQSGVHVLSGYRFFWSRPALGSQYVRVALSRDPHMFCEASGRIRACCLRLMREGASL